MPDGTWIGKFERPLIRFDLSSIPEGARVEKAELSLYCLSGERGEKRGGKRLSDLLDLPQEPAMYHKTPVWIARMLTDWDAQATLHTSKVGQKWQVPKLGAGNDFYSAPTWLFRDYMEIPGVSKTVIEDYHKWYTWDITEFAQEWVNEPKRNKGMVLLMSGLCMFDKHLEDLTEQDMKCLLDPGLNVHLQMWLLNRILWKKPSFENLEQQDYLRFASSDGPQETRSRLTITYRKIGGNGHMDK